MTVQLLFVQQRPPHGSIVGQEGLDACLMGSAFADCAMLFLGDGIYQVTKQQNTSGLHLKDYSVTYKALRDYGVSKLYCRQADLTSRQLQLSDLLVEVQPLEQSALADLVSESSQVLTF